MNDWDDAERRVEKAQELFEQRRWQEALEELFQKVPVLGAVYHYRWDITGIFDTAADRAERRLEDLLCRVPPLAGREGVGRRDGPRVGRLAVA